MNIHDIDINNDRIKSAKDADYYIKLNNKCLNLRIYLQRLLDTTNQLPINTNNSIINPNNSVYLYDLLIDLINLLNKKSNSKKIINKKRKLESNDLWNQSINIQNELKHNQWIDIINKWYNRLNFGLNSNQNKFKVFNQTLYNQIDLLLNDNERIVEKSCILYNDSKRLDKLNDNNNDSKQVINDKSYDLEVYDDRQFYSMLLKTFITSASSSNLTEGFKADELQELKKYRKTKDNVDRKASKGRKIRYVVHPKIQNFMFPITIEKPLIDVDRLYQSLFQ